MTRNVTPEPAAPISPRVPGTNGVALEIELYVFQPILRVGDLTGNAPAHVPCAIANAPSR